VFALGKQPNPFVLHEGGEKNLYIKNCTDFANSYCIRKSKYWSALGVMLTAILNLQCHHHFRKSEAWGSCSRHKVFPPMDKNTLLRRNSSVRDRQSQDGLPESIRIWSSNKIRHRLVSDP